MNCYILSKQTPEVSFVPGMCVRQNRLQKTEATGQLTQRPATHEICHPCAFKYERDLSCKAVKNSSCFPQSHSHPLLFLCPSNTWWNSNINVKVRKTYTARKLIYSRQCLMWGSKWSIQYFTGPGCKASIDCGLSDEAVRTDMQMSVPVLGTVSTTQDRLNHQVARALKGPLVVRTLRCLTALPESTTRIQLAPCIPARATQVQVLIAWGHRGKTRAPTLHIRTRKNKNTPVGDFIRMQRC